MRSIESIFCNLKNSNGNFKASTNLLLNMNFPKHPRLQMLAQGGNPSADSPLRRRSALNMSSAMLPPKTPDSVNNAKQ